MKGWGGGRKGAFIIYISVRFPCSHQAPHTLVFIECTYLRLQYNLQRTTGVTCYRRYYLYFFCVFCPLYVIRLFVYRYYELTAPGGRSWPEFTVLLIIFTLQNESLSSFTATQFVRAERYSFLTFYCLNAIRIVLKAMLNIGYRLFILFMKF